jgi:hypothetical protein
MLVAVAEGAGISLFVEERAAMLRHPGVLYRRFAAPEPTVALAIAFRAPPALTGLRNIGTKISGRPGSTSQGS